MGRIEQASTSSQRQDISQYIDRFPVLTSEQQKDHAKQFSTIEIATYLLQDIQTGIREEKTRLTPPNARGDDQKNPVLAKEVGESLLEELRLTTKVKLITDESEQLKTKDALTKKQKEERKAVIGYQWQEDIVTSEEKEKISRQLEGQIAKAKQAKETMVNHNLRLVGSVARDYKRSIPEEDRKQAGFLGLVRAVEKYDYRKGYEFSTYATNWIKQSIQREADKHNDLYLPQGLQNAVETAWTITTNFEDLHGKTPSEKIIIDLITERKLQISEVDKKDAIKIVLSKQTEVLSLYQPLKMDSESDTLLDFVASKEQQHSSVAPYPEEGRNIIINSLTDLTNKEKAAVLLSSGVDGFSEMTTSEIANALGVTEQYEQYVKNNSYKKLKNNTTLLDLSENGDVSEIQSDSPLPSGMKLETYSFLVAAKASGAFRALDKSRQKIIETYYSTEASLADAAATAGLKHRQRAYNQITSSLQMLWEELPEVLQKRYPKEEVLLLKEKTGRKFNERSRANISKGHKNSEKAKAHLHELHEASRGRKRTPEEKEHIRQAQLERWRRKKKEQEQQDDSFIQIFPDSNSA